MIKSWFENVRYRQFIYCLIAMQTIACGTIHNAWPSPFIPKLKSEDSPIGVSLQTYQTSLVVSLYLVGAFIGSFFTLRGTDFFGRKPFLIVGCVLNSVAWILIYFAKSPEILYVARLVAGMGMSFFVNAATIYVSEISDNDNRGSLGFLIIICKNIGSLLCYVAGPYMTYKSFAITGFVYTCIIGASIFLIPESPQFLIIQKKLVYAEKNLWKISIDQSTKDFIDKKMREIKTSVEQDMLNKSTFWELLTGTNYRKSLVLHIYLKTLSYFSGIMVVLPYVQTIVKNSGSSLSSNLSSIIFGICEFLTAILCGQLVDRVGRKPLLAFSSTISFIFNFILATYFYFQEATTINLDSVYWLPLTSLILFQVGVASGISPLSYVLGAELYPINVKGVAISTVALIITPLGALIQYLFEPLNELYGTYTNFWIYSAFCLSGLFFAVFILPETKGKSFEEIQEDFQRSRKELF